MEAAVGGGNPSLPLAGRVIPQGWPLDVSLSFPAPRRVYGRGAPIIWELKLFGDAARHDLFLETILPAMEAAGYTSDSRFRSGSSLWGRFDISDIYCANGRRWNHIVKAGVLHPTYKPTRIQWAKGLWDEPVPGHYRRLVWTVPLDLEGQVVGGNQMEYLPELPAAEINSPLALIMAGLGLRLRSLFPVRRGTPDLRTVLPDTEYSMFQEACALAAGVRDNRHCQQNFREKFKESHGVHVFASPLPATLLPYLDLASIVHIGMDRHLGCGTFHLLP